MLALYILFSAIGYLTVGRAYGKVSWDTWKSCPHSSLRAKLFFPLSSGAPEVYGRWASTDWRHPWMAKIFDNLEKDRADYTVVSSFIWPLFVLFTLFFQVIKLPALLGWHIGRLLLFRLPERLSSPATWKRLSLGLKPDQERLPTARALPDDNP